MALPLILIKTTSGMEGRIEFEQSGDAVAVKITWHKWATGREATPDDNQEAQYVAMMALQGSLHPSAQVSVADMGKDKAARDEAVRRFLKSNEN